MNESTNDTPQNNSIEENNFERREVLKGLATFPVLGVFFYNLWQKLRVDALKKKNLLADLISKQDAPAILSSASSGDHLRLGIIGYGGRGAHLVRSAGFSTPEWNKNASKAAEKNKLNKQYETFMQQADLNVSIVGVCDLFDVRAEQGIEASKNEIRPGPKPLEIAKRYKHHEDLIANDDIDAVIIATPDHWHSRIAIDAANAGKHVYCEKGLTRTFDEAIDLYDTVKETGITFQLGHQNRQVEANEKARQIFEQGLLGPVNLVELTINRNSASGAWVWDIHPEGNSKTIDWETFQEPSPNKIPFGEEALKRFFRWRCWFDYGTGLSGDLFSHDFDQVNQILNLGIPKYASASGGIYFYKDGRDVPDVFQATYEYPDKDLTLLISSTLSSRHGRGNMIMGHDATMILGGQSNSSSLGGFTVNADSGSSQYKDKIDSGIINSQYPIYSYSPGSKQIDGITSATAKYFASKGLSYTYREGKRVDPTHLHMKDWIDSIRNGTQPRCDIEVSLDEALACHMATESFLQGRRIEWDPKTRKLV